MSFKLNILAVYAFVLCLGGCSGQGAEHSGSKAMAAENTAVDQLPIYRVGIDASYPPFGFRGDQGQPVGFDVDVLSAAAQASHLKVVFASHPWQGVFEALNAGKYDIVTGGVTITHERKQYFDFSEPYIENEQMAVVYNSNDTVHTFADLANKKVSVMANTTSEQLMHSLLGENNPNILAGDTPYLSYRNLLTRKADVVVGDSGVMRYFIKQYAAEDLRGIVYENAPKEAFGFVVKKGRTDLQQKINQGLTVIKANGTYAKIHEKWFSSQINKPVAASAQP